MDITIEMKITLVEVILSLLNINNYERNLNSNGDYVIDFRIIGTGQAKR